MGADVDFRFVNRSVECDAQDNQSGITQKAPVLQWRKKLNEDYWSDWQDVRTEEERR